MKNYSDILFYGVLIISLFAMLFTFGAHIITDRELFITDNIKIGKINMQELNEYCLSNGYVVKDLCPIKNTNKWLAFIVKEGRFVISVIAKVDGKIMMEYE